MKNKDSVVRIGSDTHKRIKKFFQDGKQRSLKEAIQEIMDYVEHLRDGQPMYAVELFGDVAEARGAAIMKAVKTKTTPQMPKVVLIIGEDVQD